MGKELENYPIGHTILMCTTIWETPIEELISPDSLSEVKRSLFLDAAALDVSQPIQVSQSAIQSEFFHAE